MIHHVKYFSYVQKWTKEYSLVSVSLEIELARYLETFQWIDFDRHHTGYKMHLISAYVIFQLSEECLLMEESSILNYIWIYL